MRKFIMSLTTVASLSLAAVPILGLTQAANAAEQNPSVTVTFSDLDLTAPSQAAVFKARVETAGKDLCRAKMRVGDLHMPLRACVAEVHRDVQRQLPTAQRQHLAFAAQAKAIAVATK